MAAWDGDRDALTPEDLTLLADLRVAIERRELWLAYQPQIDVASGLISSVEALFRWDSPLEVGPQSTDLAGQLRELVGAHNRHGDGECHEKVLGREKEHDPLLTGVDRDPVPNTRAPTLLGVRVAMWE